MSFWEAYHFTLGFLKVSQLNDGRDAFQPKLI
jgi:hypothetical protein